MILKNKVKHLNTWLIFYSYVFCEFAMLKIYQELKNNILNVTLRRIHRNYNYAPWITI